MNAVSLARRGYSAAAAPTRSPRSTEYEAVAQITRRMQTAAREGGQGFSDLVAALHDNKRLWTIFAVEAADADNPLPADLKARLFYLAEFTHQHTSKVLARTDSIEPLVEINTAILRGLAKEAA